MIDHDRTDGGDLDLEALLRSTFADEAHHRVAESRPVPAFPQPERRATVHPIRRRWVGLSVVAAALVAVAIGATVIGTEAMHSERTPVPPATTGAPTPTPTTSTSVTTPPPTSPTSPPSSTATTPPASPTKQVAFLGVTLTVPASWNLLTDAPRGVDAAHEACLATGSTWTTGADLTDGCELTVSVGLVVDESVDVDVPGANAQGGLICGYGTGDAQRTTTADEVVVDGQVAEHRVYTAPCISHPFEQWTVPTSPLIFFRRATASTDPAAAAAAAAVVASAQLPPPASAVRLGDCGFVTAFTPGASLTIDRAVQLFPTTAALRDDDSRTFDYPVSAATKFYTPGNAELSADRFAALVAGQPVAGVAPLSQLYALVHTDGSTVQFVQLLPRP